MRDLLAGRGQASPLHIEEHREVFPTYSTIAVIFYNWLPTAEGLQDMIDNCRPELVLCC